MTEQQHQINDSFWECFLIIWLVGMSVFVGGGFFFLDAELQSIKNQILVNCSNER